MAASTSGVHAGDDLGDRATPLSGTQLKHCTHGLPTAAVQTTANARTRTAGAAGGEARAQVREPQKARYLYLDVARQRGPRDRSPVGQEVCLRLQRGNHPFPGRRPRRDLVRQEAKGVGRHSAWTAKVDGQ